MKNKQSQKTLNISLQSKKYLEPVNSIIKKWKDEGSNVSVEVCELILLSEKYDKSIVLSNIKNIYDLIEKVVAMNKQMSVDEKDMVIEKALSKIISIDNSKISEVLSTINICEPLKDSKEEIIIDKEEVTQIPEASSNNPKSSMKNDVKIEDDKVVISRENLIQDIPLDFLQNS